MGIFGTFLALGWIGGNLIKESFDQANMDKEVNSRRDPEDRIYMRNGKWYDKITGKRVIKRFINDPDIGDCCVWEDLYGGLNSEIICNSSKTAWEKENIIWKNKINEEIEKNNPVWLKEAERKELRFAKCILPYKPGVRSITKGYLDRTEYNKNGVERKYYGVYSNYMREFVFNEKQKIWWCTGELCSTNGILARYDEKYCI